MTKAQLEDRLAKVQQKKEALIAQLNALVGREAELAELIALIEKESDAG